TSSTPPIMQAQVQIIGISDPEAGRVRLLEARDELIELANAQDPKLVEFGGGVRDISVRLVPSRAGTYVVAHLQVDVRDAMGANAVNTMAEAVGWRAPARCSTRRRSAAPRSWTTSFTPPHWPNPIRTGRPRTTRAS